MTQKKKLRNEEAKMQQRIYNAVLIARPEGYGHIFAVLNGGHTPAQRQYNRGMGMVTGTMDLVGYSPINAVMYGSEIKYPGEEHKREKLLNQWEKVEMLNNSGGIAMITANEEVCKKFWIAMIDGEHEMCRKIATVENAIFKEKLKNNLKTIVF